LFQKFAGALGFGNKTNLVVDTAIRLVQRMKRDWIQTGRRPSGICGAGFSFLSFIFSPCFSHFSTFFFFPVFLSGLLIAARLHNFKLELQDIVRVVRLSDSTIYKR
jgi:transcription factor IIIB subunit 2